MIKKGDKEEEQEDKSTTQRPALGVCERKREGGKCKQSMFLPRFLLKISEIGVFVVVGVLVNTRLPHDYRRLIGWPIVAYVYRGARQPAVADSIPESGPVDDGGGAVVVVEFAVVAGHGTWPCDATEWQTVSRMSSYCAADSLERGRCSPDPASCGPN